MTGYILIAALLLGPSFAEKTNTARPALATPPVMEGCDHSDLASITGQPFDDALKARAQESSGAATVRVFTTGGAVTDDLRSDRLTVELSPNGKVVSARCY